ncbi:MAG: peptidoglycan/LPS O-acetylase OafA/YrhL [Parvicella sp.]|jgi:peptidoglycan/LPS O-acetylase OafA/YrhL
MFGLYRTLLALLVVAQHLLQIPVIGHYAVHGFFILSGYLMTYIMQQSYGYSLKGKINFAINRFLRLFPSYWFLLFLSFLLVILFKEENSIAYRGFIFLPSTFFQFFQNITLLYFDLFPGTVSPRLSPPTWALTIELFFYLFIALGVSKNKRITILWLLMGVVYFLFTYIFKLNDTYRYNMIFAGSLPFSIGAMIYYFRTELQEALKKYPTFMNFYFLFGSILLNALLAMIAGKYDWLILVEINQVVNYFLNATIIIYLIDNSPPAIDKKTDKLIGDFSYPLYLFHWQAGFAVSMLIWNEPIINMRLQGIVNCAGAVLFSVVISWLVIKFIDKPIEQIRKKIRTRINANDV